MIQIGVKPLSRRGAAVDMKDGTVDRIESILRNLSAEDASLIHQPAPAASQPRTVYGRQLNVVPVHRLASPPRAWPEARSMPVWPADRWVPDPIMAHDPLGLSAAHRSELGRQRL